MNTIRVEKINKTILTAHEEVIKFLKKNKESNTEFIAVQFDSKSKSTLRLESNQYLALSSLLSFFFFFLLVLSITIQLFSFNIFLASHDDDGDILKWIKSCQFGLTNTSLKINSFILVMGTTSLLPPISPFIEHPLTSYARIR